VTHYNQCPGDIFIGGFFFSNHEAYFWDGRSWRDAAGLAVE